MKGDFTTDRFDPGKSYTAVLKQQGRVDLDSDWNEQVAIQQHLMRTLIIDLLGPAAGPVDACGFALVDAKEEGVKLTEGDFAFGPGRYYVGGLLVENRAVTLYSGQSHAGPKDKLEDGQSYLAYLDVWERHVTWLDDPDLREVALGGPDTCTRRQTVWQVATLETEKAEPRREEAVREPAEIEAEIKKLEERNTEIDAQPAGARRPAALTAERRSNLAAIKELKKRLESRAEAPAEEADQRCWALIEELSDWKSGTLAAHLRPSEPSNSPCVLPPESRYRGLENQLYRIEVHESGDTEDPNNLPSFKWSRDNGSVTTPWLETKGKDVHVMSARGFAPNCWVEILTEADDMHCRGGHLGRVVSVEGDVLILAEAPPALGKDALNPRVRRWDNGPKSAKGAIDIVPGEADKGWIAIEDGIEIRFSKGSYRAGDYWLIPARVATGAIQWPEDSAGQPLDLPPKGVVHYYAPLFLFNATDSAPFVELVEDCRCRVAPLQCTS